jgi:hypothetical protein
MAKSPPLGDPRATAAAHRNDVVALQSIARAERRRARALRDVARAYQAEAGRESRERPAQVLRDFAAHANELAAILNTEADVHERVAVRVELAAQRADARARPPAAVGADVRPRRRHR